MKILIVCLGNICRSPLAQGVLQQKCDEAGLQVKVDSAGTAGYHQGEPPHPDSIKVAQENGISISHQRGRMFKTCDIQEYDKILAMDRSNYCAIKTSSGKSWDESKVSLFLNELNPGKNEEVPDPWYGTYDGYKDVYKLIDATCDRIVEKLKNELSIAQN